MSANEGRKASTTLLTHVAAASSQVSVGHDAYGTLCVLQLTRPRRGMDPQPVPLSQLVLKVHNRCDMARDHCYVYEAADQRWRGQPMVISSEAAAACSQYPAALRSERSRLR